MVLFNTYRYIVLKIVKYDKWGPKTGWILIKVSPTLSSVGPSQHAGVLT